jgi:hypothetical protein
VSALVAAPPVENLGRFEKHTLPNGDVVYYEDSWHRYCTEVYPNKKGGYSYKKASKLLGVSTIAKYLDANIDPLLYWAAKLDQTGIAELASQAIAADADLTWLCQQPTIAEALKGAELTWRHVRDRAAERGTNVHKRILNALATGETPPSLGDLEEHERGYGQGVFKWWRDRKPEPVAAERVTASLELGFGGRFDLLADVGEGRGLFDAKTREKGAVRQSDHVQLEGYEVGNRHCEIPESDFRAAVIFMPDGTYREQRSLAREDHFLAALSACRAGAELNKVLRAAEKAAEKATEEQQQMAVAA